MKCERSRVDPSFARYPALPVVVCRGYVRTRRRVSYGPRRPATAVAVPLASVTMTELIVPLITLTFLEIVLGVDNVIFISILSAKLPKEQQKKARRIGLIAAMLMRLGAALVDRLDFAADGAAVHG